MAWDEPILFECDAEAPYNDDCYAYVIEIDPPVEQLGSICEGEYQECLGREIDYEDYQTMILVEIFKSLTQIFLKVLENERLLDIIFLR